MTRGRFRDADRWEHGELQTRVLELVRSHGPSTVRDVHERLSDDHPVAYTTVQTVLSRLVERGFLERQLRGNVGVYSTLRSDDPAAADRVVEELVGRFGPLAVTQFVARARLDPAMLEELRRLVEEEPRER
ncbi:MAG: BlaI/MecI/CopY family transcriptional regulator [Gaiellaceae bacterium]